MSAISRKRVTLGSMAATMMVAAALLGPASAAQAYGTSPEELISACENGIDQEGVSVNCSFESDHVSSSFVEWHRFGAAVTNCTAGTTVDVKQWVGDLRTYTQTWTVGGTAKLNLGPIGIEGKGELSQAESRTSERRSEVIAAPGQKVAATLGKTIDVVEGRMKVLITDNGGYQDGSSYAVPETYYIDNIQRTAPTTIEEVGVDQVACGELFKVDPETTPV